LGSSFRSTGTAASQWERIHFRLACGCTPRKQSLQVGFWREPARFRRINGVAGVNVPVRIRRITAGKDGIPKVSEMVPWSEGKLQNVGDTRHVVLTFRVPFIAAHGGRDWSFQFRFGAVRWLNMRSCGVIAGIPYINWLSSDPYPRPVFDIVSRDCIDESCVPRGRLKVVVGLARSEDF